jgi:hypothetical protein
MEPFFFVFSLTAFILSLISLSGRDKDRKKNLRPEKAKLKIQDLP